MQGSSRECSRKPFFFFFFFFSGNRSQHSSSFPRSHEGRCTVHINAAATDDACRRVSWDGTSRGNPHRKTNTTATCAWYKKGLERGGGGSFKSGDGGGGGRRGICNFPVFAKKDQRTNQERMGVTFFVVVVAAAVAPSIRP